MADEVKFLNNESKPFHMTTKLAELLNKAKLIKFREVNNEIVAMTRKEAKIFDKKEGKTLEFKNKKNRKILTPQQAIECFRKFSVDVNTSFKEYLSFEKPINKLAEEKELQEARLRISQATEKALEKQKSKEAKVDEPVNEESTVEEPMVDEPTAEVNEVTSEVEADIADDQETIDVKLSTTEIGTPEAYEELANKRKEFVDEKILAQLVKETGASEYWVSRALYSSNNDLDLARNWLDDRGKIDIKLELLEKENNDIKKQNEELVNVVKELTERIDKLEKVVLYESSLKSETDIEGNSLKR